VNGATVTERGISLGSFSLGSIFSLMSLEKVTFLIICALDLIGKNIAASVYYSFYQIFVINL